MDATQAAAEAVTNGSAPEGVNASMKLIGAGSTLATELGFGFLTAALAATAGTYSVNRFIAAYRLVRG